MAPGTDLSEDELIRFTQKLIKDLYPNVEPRRDKITPRICAWALDLAEEMLLASSGVTFLEEIWKGSFPGAGNLRSIKEVANLLKDSAKAGVKSYLKGERKLMVQVVVKNKWRSIVTGYVTGQGEFHESDFVIPITFSDRIRKLF